MTLHLNATPRWKSALCCLLLAASVLAQTKSLNNEDVIKMVKSNFSEEMIVKVIEANGGAFDTSVAWLLKLKQAGVGEKALGAMMAPGSRTIETKPARPVPAPRHTESEGAPTNIAPPNTAAKPAVNLQSRIEPKVELRERATSKPVTPAYELPEDEGIYLAEGGQLVELFPEVVNWKTGGALKSMASMGISKGHVNGTVRNPHSKRQTGAPVEIVIRCAQGTAPTEYQLLNLWEKDNRREFRAHTGGVIHASGGAQKNAVDFEPIKIGSGVYKIVLTDLKKGEYGFLAPGWQGSNMASNGKIHTFGIE